MRRPLLVLFGTVAAVSAGLAIYWRFFPRAGLKWTNEVANPWFVERGWSGSGTSEIGTLEHVGRKTGTRHLTPVHPVPTPDGFRIVVPLAEKSEWAKNVLAAGHCRLQLHDTIYELDEPLLVRPVDVREAPVLVRRIAQMLGWEYMRLHRFAEAPGTLEPTEVASAEAASAAPAVAEAAGAAPAAPGVAQVAEAVEAPGVAQVAEVAEPIPAKRARARAVAATEPRPADGSEVPAG